MNATIQPAPAIWTTCKGAVKAGVNLSQPVTVFYGSDPRNAQRRDYLSLKSTRQGVLAVKADGTEVWLGGVATKFWIQQTSAINVPAAAVLPSRTVVKAAPAPAAEAPVAQGDELDSLKFAELMTIAKALKVPGRGTARIDALREGIRAARKA